MTVPYVLRLLWLCLASFFLLHLAFALAVSAVAPWAIRHAQRMRAQAGARLLLALRLLPAGLASIVVAGICAPSYLWLEPDASAEEVGLVFLGVALVGGGLWAAGLVRAARAAVRSRRWLRDCPRMIQSDAPVLMLAGVLRPRLVVSRGVVGALAPEQLSVALRHEWAHRISHDNLKRLVLLGMPDVLPGVHGLRALDLAWARLAEWAADDRAVGGSSQRSLALAAALVRVARMGSAPRHPAVATSLMADGQELAARVDRLLHPAVRPETSRIWLAGAAACGVALAAAALQPETLRAAHGLLELLVR
jgi:hypothetical protein